MPRYWVQYALPAKGEIAYENALLTTKDAKEAADTVLQIHPTAEIMEVKEDV